MMAIRARMAQEFTLADRRRVYYDHEPAYEKIARTGGHGWDDLKPGPDQGSYEALDAFLRSKHAPRSGDSVLDLGCGGGQAALRVARLGCRVLGVDFSETAIELARANARRKGLDARFERGDALDLGEIGPFDVVLDNHLLHCLVGVDRQRSLAEVRRVLRPSGTFFSETMSCEGDFDPARFDADPVTRVARNGMRVWVSRRELEAELEVAGFEVLELGLRPDPQPGVGSTIVVVGRSRLLPCP